VTYLQLLLKGALSVPPPPQKNMAVTILYFKSGRHILTFETTVNGYFLSACIILVYKFGHTVDVVSSCYVEIWLFLLLWLSVLLQCEL